MVEITTGDCEMAEGGWEEVDRLVELKALNCELEEKRGKVVN